MFKQKELEKLEKNIKKTISIIEREHFNLSDGGTYNDFEEEHPGFTNIWIENRLKDLYVLILTYFEARQLPQLLTQFKQELDLQFNKNIFEEKYINPEASAELKITLLFRRYLDAFSFFQYNATSEDNYTKLHSILSNSGHILKKLNIDPKNETDIYKNVKWVLDLYFSSCRLLNKASFIQKFKTYIPDILIPELSVAIEYKYLKSDKDNIDDFLDQIKIDSTGYVNDQRYDIFYAVVFISDISISTPESIEDAWKSKKFPDNWKLVVTGNYISNKQIN